MSGSHVAISAADGSGLVLLRRPSHGLTRLVTVITFSTRTNTGRPRVHCEALIVFSLITESAEEKCSSEGRADFRKQMLIFVHSSRQQLQNNDTQLRIMLSFRSWCSIWHLSSIGQRSAIYNANPPPRSQASSPQISGP